MQQPSEKTRAHMIGSGAVRRMGDLCKEGLSYNQIAQTLNKEGYRTVMGRPYSSANVLLLLQQFEGDYERMRAGATETELVPSQPSDTECPPATESPAQTSQEGPQETEPEKASHVTTSAAETPEFVIPERPVHPSVAHLTTMPWDEVVPALAAYLQLAWIRVDDTWAQLEQLAKAHQELEQKQQLAAGWETELIAVKEQHEKLRYEFEVQKLALDEKDQEIARLKAELEAQSSLPKQRQLSERDVEALNSLSGYRA